MSENTVLTIASVATAVATAVIGIIGYQVQGASQEAIEQLRAQTTQQQTLLNSQYQTRQLDIEMVKLALNILGGEISDKTTQSRMFAVQVLQQYSGIRLSEKDADNWIQTGTVAFKLPQQGLGSTSSLNNWMTQEAGREAIEEILRGKGLQLYQSIPQLDPGIIKRN